MEKTRRKTRLVWLLIVPFLALGWVPFYNAVEPSLFGIPFFYWYQFLWVFLTPALTYAVYARSGRHQG